MDRRSLRVVQQPLDQVRGRRHVFQPLLILDADGVTAEVVGDAHGSDVHLALLQDLVVGQVRVRVGAGHEGHTALIQPTAHRLGLSIRDASHFRYQRRLAQPFFVEAGAVHQLIVDDSVVHAHAALVEDAQDGLFPSQLTGQGLAQLDFVTRQSREVQVSHVAGVVSDATLFQPLADAVQEEIIGEVLAPDGAVWDAHFGQAAVQVKQPHQPRPLA